MDEVTPRVAKSLRCRSVLVPALCLLAFASTRDAVAQQVNLRSIGSPGFYAIGTVSVTNGSPNVTGLGTAWLTANRGRGDVITIPCSSAPVCPGGTSYTVASVSAEGALQLTQPFAGVSGGASYAIQRQFTTLAAWEDCVNGPPGGGCGFFPVLSSSLVADGRSEVGIAYKDSVFTLAGPVDIDGSITDATHTITLTADGANRHLGLAGTGVVLNNGVNGGPALRVRDDHVTVEWLEITNGQGAGAHPIQADNQAPANGLVFRNLLLHDAGGNGIEIRDSDTIADLYDNIVYKRSTAASRSRTARSPGRSAS